MGKEGFVERHWSPRQPDRNLFFFFLFLFPVMSFCKWRSYFNFIESCPVGTAATWSQHKKKKKKKPCSSTASVSFGDKMCPSRHRKYLSSFKLITSTARGTTQPLHIQPTQYITPACLAARGEKKAFTWAGDKLSFDLKWTISLNTCIPNESTPPSLPALALCLSCY